jgi:hypothetical protein
MITFKRIETRSGTVIVAEHTDVVLDENRSAPQKITKSYSEVFVPSKKAGGLLNANLRLQGRRRPLPGSTDRQKRVETAD